MAVRRAARILPYPSLGKVAGIGGIARGVLVLLLRPVIEQSLTLPDAIRGCLLLTVTIGAFAIGALGVVLWVLSNRTGAQVASTEGDCEFQCIAATCYDLIAARLPI